MNLKIPGELLLIVSSIKCKYFFNARIYSSDL